MASTDIPQANDPLKGIKSFMVLRNVTKQTNLEAIPTKGTQNKQYNEGNHGPVCDTRRHIKQAAPSCWSCWSTETSHSSQGPFSTSLWLLEPQRGGSCEHPVRPEVQTLGRAQGRVGFVTGTQAPPPSGEGKKPGEGPSTVAHSSLYSARKRARGGGGVDNLWGF